MLIGILSDTHGLLRQEVIDELCIRTDRQGAGAGTFFLAEIEKTIKELGLKQIFLQIEAHAPAYEFYKRTAIPN